MALEHNYENFREYLQNEFVRRASKNSAYSLRSFAKSLDINDSTLSKILNGNMKITEKRCLSLSQKLSLDMVELMKIRSSLSDKVFLNQDQFKVLAQWYCFAILELIKTKNFKNDSGWIAKRLGITTGEVKIAVERLEKAKLIERGPDSKLSLVSANNRWDGDIFLQMAHRKLQEQFIQKSLDTLFEVEPSEKENSSLTVACSRDMLPEIKNRIKKFKTEIDDLIEKNCEPTDVYQLNVSFFPITNKESSNE